MMTQYVIYDRPTDYPKDVVVRRWHIGPLGAILPSAAVLLVRTLDHARAAIPPGYVRTPRNPSDDPKIVEVWL